MSDLLRYFHPVLESKSLKKSPFATQIGDLKVVLYRGVDGQPAALEDKCPHRFTPLSAGHVSGEGRLVCPYHGWNFDSEGKTKNPSLNNREIPCKVRHFQVVEKFNYLWIANPDVPMSCFPKMPGPDKKWKLVSSFATDLQAPFYIALDNFSENEHFPYIHEWFGWGEEHAHLSKVKCIKHEDSVEVRNSGKQRSFLGARLFGIKKDTWMENNWVTRFDPVWTSYRGRVTDIDGNFTGEHLSDVSIYFQPVGRETTRLHIFQFVHYANKWAERFGRFTEPLSVSALKRDIQSDVDFIKNVKHLPNSLEGAYLGRFDQALIYNREFLEKIYFGSEGSSKQAEPAPQVRHEAQPELSL